MASKEQQVQTLKHQLMMDLVKHKIHGKVVLNQNNLTVFTADLKNKKEKLNTFMYIYYKQGLKLGVQIYLDELNDYRQ